MSQFTASPGDPQTGQRTSADVPRVGTAIDHANEAVDILAAKIRQRNERLARDVNGEHRLFDIYDHDAAVLAAALIDAGWTLEAAARWLPDFAIWSERERPSITAAANKITAPWERLGEVGGRAAAEARQALEEAAPTVAEDSGDWTASDFDAVDLEAPVSFVPGPLADRVIFAEGLTTFAGEGDTFKSTIAQAVALDAVRAGVFVVHIDYEQGPKLTARKYARLGATGEERQVLASGHFWQPGAITPAKLATVINGREALVIIDSFSKAADAAGLGSTDWPAHGAFANDLNAFGVEHECAVLLIDHQANDTKYADGAKGKFYAASAQWRVQVPARKRPTEHVPGEATLTKTKHGREGGLDTHARYGLGGDGLDKIRVRRLDAGDATPLAKDLQIIEFLRAHHEDGGDPLPLDRIAHKDAVKGRATEVRNAVKRLAADPQGPVLETDGRYAFDPSR